MSLILIIAVVVLFILFFLYEEHRKKIRIPIVVLVIVIMATFLSPAVRCAVNMSPASLATFNWKVISFQHENCLFESRLNDMLGG